MKKTIVVPPKAEHRVGDVWYEAGKSYEIEVKATQKGAKNAKKAAGKS